MLTEPPQSINLPPTCLLSSELVLTLLWCWQPPWRPTLILFALQNIELLTWHWQSHPRISISGSAWYRCSSCLHDADRATPISRSQRVRDLVVWAAYMTLTEPPLHPALRKFVISLFELLSMRCWQSHCHVPVSARESSHCLSRHIYICLTLDDSPSLVCPIATSCSLVACPSSALNVVMPGFSFLVPFIT
jgi:hypothetical protein